MRPSEHRPTDQQAASRSMLRMETYKNCRAVLNFNALRVCDGFEMEHSVVLSRSIARIEPKILRLNAIPAVAP